MKTFLRENLSSVLDFLTQIISNPQAVAKETFLDAFSAANHWCDFSTKTFIPHEGFMTQVFFFLSTTTIIHGVNVSLKVTKIIKKLLEKSKNAKLLESISNYRDAF